MKGFDKLHIKSAVKSRNKFNLDFTHITTSDFGQIQPLACIETLPGDSFDVKPEYFARLAPMVKPTYGKFSFNTVVGFVPVYQLADDAEAFFNNMTSWEGVTPKIRYFTVRSLATFFTGQLNLYVMQTGDSDDGKGHIVNGGNVVYSYDAKYIDSFGNYQFGQWTPVGKFYYKILVALGYRFPSVPDFQSSSTWWSGYGTVKLNAMPLLAFCKLYNDWMSQSQRYNTSLLTTMLRSIKHNLSTSGYNPGTASLDDMGILYLLQGIKLCYETDYFLAAWMHPNNPTAALDYNNGITVPYSDADTVIGSNDITYLNNDDTTTINQRSLNFLKSFDDWVRRHNYAGSRAVQQIYARFGIKTEDFRSNYANLISTSKNPISIGDVTATASTDLNNGENIPLGDYSGKGIMHTGESFKFKASDFGYLFVFGYFTVAPMNCYGFDRKVLKTTALDFYQPEFDGLDGNAISCGELFVNPIADNTDPTTDDSVYGFTERYNEYRFSRDILSGEMLDYHTDGDMNCWHSGRLLNDIRKAGTMIAQSSSMVNLEQYNSPFNRIFTVPNKNYDHFYLTVKFNITAERNILSLNQVPGLGEGDTVVARNGVEVN